MSNTLVVGLGMGTVFVGLICIVFICYIMSALCKLFEKKAKTEEIKTPSANAQPKNAPIQNKQEIVAACCAVIAEEIGTDAKNIRVLSFKRV